MLGIMSSRADFLFSLTEHFSEQAGIAIEVEDSQYDNPRLRGRKENGVGEPSHADPSNFTPINRIARRRLAN